MKSLVYSLTAFLVGFLIMVLEIIGSRVLAPYVGTTIIVWTSLIGVILGSLSLGYYLGGKLADKKPEIDILFFLLVIPGLHVLLIAYYKEIILSAITILFSDLKLSSLASSDQRKELLLQKE